jgi:hypothetical protein
LQREGRVFRKLSTIPVEVRYPNTPAASSK